MRGSCIPSKNRNTATPAARIMAAQPNSDLPSRLTNVGFFCSMSRFFHVSRSVSNVFDKLLIQFGSGFLSPAKTPIPSQFLVLLFVALLAQNLEIADLHVEDGAVLQMMDLDMLLALAFAALVPVSLMCLLPELVPVIRLQIDRAVPVPLGKTAFLDRLP